MMKKRYFLPALSIEEKLFYEYLLAEEVDRQRWYIVLYLDLWNAESIISIQ
jgi:hypothetical protein